MMKDTMITLRYIEADSLQKTEEPMVRIAAKKRQEATYEEAYTKRDTSHDLERERQRRKERNGFGKKGTEIDTPAFSVLILLNVNDRIQHSPSAGPVSDQIDRS